MLSQKQLEDVCLIDRESDACRYLMPDLLKYGVWHCTKCKKVEKKRTDDKIELFVLECLKKGLDPAATQVAMGDNCAGYPMLKYIEQGYDQ